MAMGDLARLPNLDDLRPDEAGDSYDVPLDPWQRAAIAAQALEQRAPPQPTGPPPNMGSLYGMAGAGEIAKAAGEKWRNNADYYLGMAQRQQQGVTPEVPGQWSEDDEARQQQLLAERYQWGPQTAFGMVFDPFGVKRSIGAAGSLTSGAGSRIIQPEVPAIIEPAGRTSGIRAYHSSPFDFDKFDFSPARARTGEGAQVKGEGGYFAENPAVSGQGGQYWNDFTQRFPSAEMDAAHMLERVGFDRDKAIALARQRVEQSTTAADSDNVFINASAPYFLSRDQAALDLLKSNQRIIGPRTYEVKIKAHPDEMLNYDVPLSEQSPYVQSVLEQIGSAQKNRPLLPSDVGGDLYLKQTQGLSNDSASRRLQEAGIPGIRYLDEGSRFRDVSAKRKLLADYQEQAAKWKTEYAKQGLTPDPFWENGIARLTKELEEPLTSNYVMFPGTEDKIHILRKYGLAGAVPTMGSLADMSYREQ